MPPVVADSITISGGVTVALVVIALIELALAVYCIVDIVRRPAVTGGRKWVWIVFVAVFNLIGSVVYLAAGRAQPPAAETRTDAEPETTARSRTAAAADLLYGPPPGAVDAPAAQAPAGQPSAAPETPASPAKPEDA